MVAEDRVSDPMTWIRPEPGAPSSVCVYVYLGEGRTLLIREDGSHTVARSWHGGHIAPTEHLEALFEPTEGA